MIQMLWGNKLQAEVINDLIERNRKPGANAQLTNNILLHINGNLLRIAQTLTVIAIVAQIFLVLWLIDIHEYIPLAG